MKRFAQIILAFVATSWIPACAEPATSVEPDLTTTTSPEIDAPGPELQHAEVCVGGFCVGCSGTCRHYCAASCWISKPGGGGCYVNGSTNPDIGGVDAGCVD